MSPTENPVYSAVRCLDNATGAAALQAFRDAFGPALASVRGHDQRGRLWPIWRHVIPQSEWWLALDAYRAQLLADVADLMDSVIEPLRAAAQVTAAPGDLAAAGEPDANVDGEVELDAER